MTAYTAKVRKENAELITSQDLILSAHALMDGIDLDVASSTLANEYVGAKEFYTPLDDGLNAQPWHGKVYLFPPSGCYFWEEKNQRWKMTRSSSPTLASSYAVWFRRLYKEWMAGQIEQGLYFSNCPDMFRYEQKLFDLPVCILKTAPVLMRRIDNEVSSHKTSTSFLVYFPPLNDSTNGIDRFIELYSSKGRILY